MDERIEGLKRLYDSYGDEYVMDWLLRPSPFMSLILSDTDFLENTAKFAYPRPPIPIVCG